MCIIAKAMTVHQIRQKYVQFFKNRGHQEIAPSPLIPTVDTGTLFTPFGMQQMVPYLLGKKHPKGKRIVNSQPSIRLEDIEEVGNNRHTTFFEMLGNWSLGDYFKEEQLNWIFQFLTDKEEGLGINANRLYVTVFAGNEEFNIKENNSLNKLSKDTESINIWKDIFKKSGVNAEEGERIFAYPDNKNWWSMSGKPVDMPVGDIGGPDSEIFFDFGEDLKIHESSEFAHMPCHVNCDCGRFVEIANSVFMQYKKIDDNTFEELPNKNVDFGGGLERIAAAINGDPDVFKIDVFSGVINQIENITNKKYQDNYKPSMRIIADHMRASVFLANDGVVPSNKEHGYILRRLIRRSAVKMRSLKDNVNPGDFDTIVDRVIESYEEIYLSSSNSDEIKNVINSEVEKFKNTLEKGLKEIEKIDKIDAKTAFDLYQSYGFPIEITEEIFEEKGQSIDREVFKKEFEKHQNLSRTTSAGKFKGGLAGSSEQIKKLHTTAHLLQAALRQLLGERVVQKGQNINEERLRFDFSYNSKLTDEEIKKLEEKINQKVQEKLPVQFIELPKEQAEKSGAIHLFGEKYGDIVKVYFIGENLENAFSKEFCGGPHVQNTGNIGHVTIDKQEKTGANTVRIYATIN